MKFRILKINDKSRQHLLSVFVKTKSQIFFGSPEVHPRCSFEIQHIKKSDRKKLANESTHLFS